MKNNIPNEQREEIRIAIKSYILEGNVTVSAFCRANKISRNMIDGWFYDDRLPSPETALRLEKISNGKLTKEFICPNVEW